MSDLDRKAEIGGTVTGVAVEKTQSVKSCNPCASIEEVSSHQNNSSVAAAQMRDAPKITYKLGDKVEGNFRGSNKWKLGRIYKCNTDKTYHISYDDGDHEEFIAASKLRKFVEASKTTAVAPAAGHVYKEGYTVNTNYFDRGSFLQARICFAHADGTYDVIYSNGFTEYRKAESSLFAAYTSLTWKWNGTYDVLYLDGRCVKGYPKECVIRKSSVDYQIVSMLMVLIAIVVLIIVQAAKILHMMDEL
eukprot:gene7929-9449_t